MPDAEWSDRPTKNGYYWVKTDFGTEIVMVYDVEHGFDPYCAMASHIGHDWDTSICNSHFDGARWHGPIEKPKI